MPAYDPDFSTPPAPVTRVTLRNPALAKSVTDVPMLIDSGADTSLIPSLVLDALGLTTNDFAATGVRLVGFDGSTSMADAVQVEMRVFDRTFRGEFLLCESTYGIIGRDILNHIRLLLDGPQLVWEVVE